MSRQLPSAMIGDRVLLVIPHPDDEVVGCGAAIAAARSAGARVFGVYLTDGVPPPATDWPWRRRRHPARVAQRWAEANAAAELLGVEVVARQAVSSRTLRHHLSESYDTLRRAADDIGADRIWAPAYEGAHQDHDVANFLVSYLAARLPVWEFAEYNRIGGTVRANQFGDATGAEATLRLHDAEIDLKRRALGIYRSERGNLGHVARLFQESFRPLHTYNYNQPAHPGRQYYQRFQWVRHPRVDATRPADVIAALAMFSTSTTPASAKTDKGVAAE